MDRNSFLSDQRIPFRPKKPPIELKKVLAQKGELKKFDGVGFPSSSVEIALALTNYNDPNGYYSKMGIDPGATQEEIKRAFKRLSKEGLHPDLGGDEEQYSELTQIYKILTDPELKMKYDHVPTGYIFVGPLEESLSDFNHWEPFMVPFKESQKHWTYFSYEEQNDLAQEWYRVLLPCYQLLGLNVKVRISIEAIDKIELRSYFKSNPLLVISDKLEPNFFVALYLLTSINNLLKSLY